MIFIKNKAFLLVFFIYVSSFLLFFGAGCRTTIKYRDKPLSTPPQKYYISDYKTKKELYFEYQHALMTIKEWQLWYNIQVKTNYYNYKDITNISELNIEMIDTNLINTISNQSVVNIEKTNTN